MSRKLYILSYDINGLINENDIKFRNDFNDYAFIGLQGGINNYDKIKQAQRILKYMNMESIKINNEYMATMYDRNGFKYLGISINFNLNNLEGPVTMLFFEYMTPLILTNKKLCVINIDAGNNGNIKNFDKSAIAAIKSMKNATDIIQILKTCDIIMMGNFNSDLQNYKYEYKLPNNNVKNALQLFMDKEFNNPGGRLLFNINTTKNTCCYDQNPKENLNKKYDHILSTFINNEYIEPTIDNPQTYHLPIMANVEMKKIIGYDFDGVIHTNVESEANGYRESKEDINNPFEIILKQIREQLSYSWIIYIITARNKEELSLNLIKNFLSSHGININLDNIIFTNNESKVPYIYNLMINEFYDDSCAIIREIYFAKNNSELPLLTKIYFTIPEKNEYHEINEDNINTYCKKSLPPLPERKLANALQKQQLKIMSEQNLNKLKTEPENKLVDKLEQQKTKSNIEHKSINESEKIIVLSYNIFYKGIIDPKKHKITVCNPITIKDNYRISKCLGNIIELINNNVPYTFVGLQEAVNYNIIQNESSFLKNEMNVIATRSKNDNMATFFNYTHFEFIENVEFDFNEIGRPVNMLFFKYKTPQNLNRLICVINIHRGHSGKINDFDKLAIKAINNKPNANEIIDNLKTCDIIMMGDFNDNLQNYKYKYQLYNGNIKIALQLFVNEKFDNPGGRLLFNINTKKTCCYYEPDLGGHLDDAYDHILSTFIYIKYDNLIINNTHKSDHLPVKATIDVKRRIGYNIDKIISDYSTAEKTSVNSFENIMEQIKNQISFSWKVYIFTTYSRLDYDILMKNNINIKLINIIIADNTSIIQYIHNLMINEFYSDDYTLINNIYTTKMESKLPILTAINLILLQSNEIIKINKKNINDYKTSFPYTSENVESEIKTNENISKTTEIGSEVTPETETINEPKESKLKTLTSETVSKVTPKNPIIKKHISHPTTYSSLLSNPTSNYTPLTSNDINITTSHPLPILSRSTNRQFLNMGFSDLLRELNNINRTIHNTDQMKNIAESASIINTIVKNYNYKFDNPKINSSIENLKQILHNFIINNNLSEPYLKYINLLEYNTILLMTYELNSKLPIRRTSNTRNVELSIINTINYFTSLLRTNPQLEIYINNILRTYILQDRDYQLLQIYINSGFDRNIAYIMVILNIVLTKLIGRNIF